MQSASSPAPSDGIQRSSRFSSFNIFKRDYDRYDGVPKINIYLLRVLYILMFIFLSYDSWVHILNHKGNWEVTDATAWCVWLGYGAISWIGIIHPLKMLPIVLLEIVYKTAWLFIVAYPLWTKNELTGSPVEATTYVFTLVILPIVAMPWRYFFRTYIVVKRRS
ncbi:MAG TPA: hypothetical protein VK671_04735 [Mucilaginibacter sp.]|nr:hypothetical protein [Mucilaginibacter sp.]